MNEKNIMYVRYGLYTFAVIVVVWIGWLLFRNISDNGTTANSVRTELDNIRAEQRATKESLDSIQQQLTDSQRTVSGLEQSISDAQKTTDRIAAENSNIKAAINNATEYNNASANIIADSEQRIRESKSIIQEIREGTK